MKNILYLIWGISAILLSVYAFINIDKIRFKPWTDKYLSYESKIKLFKGILAIIITGAILMIISALGLIILYHEF